MEQKRVILAGHLGPLAKRTLELLREATADTGILEFGKEPSVCPPPQVLFCFPFRPLERPGDRSGYERDLAWLSDVLSWSADYGVKRVVLRSCSRAYGFSFKNYGLMEEERGSLLSEYHQEYRWLAAEQLVFRGSPPYSAVALRLTNVTEPGEGDFITRLLHKRVAFPAAGYDPRIQFVSLEDAARALVAAGDSETSGVFNISGPGCVEFRRSLRSAVPLRIPIPYSIQKPMRTLFWRLRLSQFDGDATDQIQYNWTVSPSNAMETLNFSPEQSSAQALSSMLKRSASSASSRISEDCDEFGLDPQYLKFFSPWFSFLRKIYWRVEIDGMDNIPRSGGAILLPNHRGFMPFDGVVHRSSILEATGRQVRFLVIPSLFKFPFLSDFLIKQGGVVASQLNAKRLFDREELVGIFPEGISGAFRMFKGAYRLGAFGRDAFARLAIQHQVPIIPAAVIGHVEIFPILAKLHISSLIRLTGWPFIPVTPTFPLLPLPLPTKWHIRYLEPITVDHLAPEQASDRKVVKELSRQVRVIMQGEIDSMLARRKHIFFGRIFESDPGSTGISAPAKS